MRRPLVCSALLLAAGSLPAVAHAQGTPAPTASAAPAPMALTAEQYLAAAVLALPTEMRAGATVMRAGPDGKAVVVRQGQNGMTCFLPNPTGARFQSACYHESLEPFMARGRELRAQGVKGDQVDTVRFAEAKAGKLKLPAGPASLYQLFGEAGAYDPATNTVKGGNPLFVVYIPNATAESTGLQTKPVRGSPWLMQAGTPKAHIMFTPTM
jgi:hypothetical protein